VLHIRGITLPDEVERDLYIVGDRIREEPVTHAETVASGVWIVPGLVDMHTHPGAEEPGQPFDDGMFERHVRSHRDAGVLTIRCPGLVELLPDRLRRTSSPRIVAAGSWLAAPGGFFEGWGQQMPVDDIPAAAEEQVGLADGWCKVVADWMTTDEKQRRYGPTIPPDVLDEIVRRVHAAGGRVAVHTQHPEGAEAAVMAGADSIEHGMHMSESLLDRMASQGTALVPTMTAFSTIPAAVQTKEAPDDFSRFMLAGWQRHPSLVRSAWEAGVTVLAGTDDLPHGNVIAEVDQLIDAGIPVNSALGAASWLALNYLGIPFLQDDARADLITFRSDPRIDGEFRRPEKIIAAGVVIS
jgi:imidazolonepropionase-like amidohydrolase